MSTLVDIFLINTLAYVRSVSESCVPNMSFYNGRVYN